MRVSPPAGLRQNAADLLADVRDRLASRLPDRTDVGDPTDPGWLLLEQAAWMVEQLSGQLDDYPLGIVQQLLHLMGARLLPARPALGVVGVEVERAGTLDWDPARLAPLRLFTEQSEAAEMVEFAPVERGVSLRPLSIAGISALREGELYRPAESRASAIALWQGALQRSTLFQGERTRYRFVAANVENLKTALNAAIARLAEARIGWLQLEIEDEDARGLTLVARVDPAAAFAPAAPSGLTPGGDLVADWGTLDDVGWTPSIRVADDPSVPLRLRGRTPLPEGDGRILLPGLPANLPIDGLLVSRAAPLPTDVCVAIWTTLTHADTRLAEYRPVIQRSYPEPDTAEPQWIGGAIDSDLWYRLAPGPRTLVHVRLGEGEGTVRVGLVFQGGDTQVPPIQVFAEERSGLVPDAPLEHRIAWRLPCPAREPGRGSALAVALDVQVPAGALGVLVAVEGPCEGAIGNPMLVIQAPGVRDGREVPIDRNVPEGVSLLRPDIVGPDVVADLLTEPLPEETRALLRALPLAWFEVTRQEPVVDFAGVGLDPSAGEMTLNGVDWRGVQRPFRRGDQLQLRWYRATDGGLGNVAAGALQTAEQEGGDGPLLVRVENPLPTFYGSAREEESAAITRLFGPSDSPVLPGDFERQFRHALGTHAAGWEIRCWTYAERALVTTALWPLPRLGVEGDPDRAALLAELAEAGPEKLLVLVGPRSGEMSAADLDWARRTIRGVCARLGRRLPTVRDAVVGRLWPLTLECQGPMPEVALPCFTVEGLAGELVDERGRRAAPPRALLLNAAVVQTRRVTT